MWKPLPVRNWLPETRHQLLLCLLPRLFFLPTARDLLLKSSLAQDLAELHSRLSMSGTSALQEFYRSAPFACRIGPGHFSSAKAMQLVAAWKQLSA